MQEKPFRGNFTQQEPIAGNAIDAAVNVLRSGRLHRYNTPSDDTVSYTSELGAAFAGYTNQSFCPACRFSLKARPIWSSTSTIWKANLRRPARSGCIDRWNAQYRTLAAGLEGDPSVVMPARPEAERFVDSSIQFLVPKFSAEECEGFVNRCAEHGVELKWFGGTKPVGYTSTHRHWGYVPGEALPETDRIFAQLFDMRIPLTFSFSDCEHIARIIRSVLSRMRHSQAVN